MDKNHPLPLQHTLAWVDQRFSAGQQKLAWVEQRFSAA